MFERYDEAARRLMFFSRYEASQLGDSTIEPEHLLLGLVRECHGIAAQVLLAAGTTPERLRQDVLKDYPVKTKTPTHVEIPFSGTAKRVLQFAAAEADAVGHDHIGSEHLLLGLLREETSLAARTLAANGVRLADARRSIAAAKPEPAGQDPAQADAFERIEQIRTAVAQLGVMAAAAERTVMVSAIGTQLDDLKRILRSSR
jgi:ATP-dependent Clp protease ATP-binding subunit ClpC